MERQTDHGRTCFRRAGPVALSSPELDIPYPAELDHQIPENLDQPTEHDFACEAGVVRARSVPPGPARQQRECRQAAGHVPYRSWYRACVAGPAHRDAHRTSRTSSSNVTVLDCGYIEDEKTLGEHESGPSPILVTRSSSTRVTTGGCATVQGHNPSSALIRAIAAQSRARHGMTVLAEDSTAYEYQDNTSPPRWP